MATKRIPAVLVAVLALAASLLAAGPVAADVVTPSTRTFGSVIDVPATWERESSCSPTEKKGAKKLRKLLLATYGPIGSNIVRACSRSDSGHEEGRAIDWMVNVRVPEQKAIADSFLTWLQAPDAYGNPAAMARRIGVSYVIWNNQMWRPSSGLWTPYSDCMKPKRRFKKYDNTCHRNHIHTSLSWDGALARTSFFTGYVACPAPVTEPWVPALWPASTMVVPLPAARVLGTARGIGLPTGPCRVHPDVRSDVYVLGAAGLPATGVAAVQVRVTVTKPDAPAGLRVWTAGTLPPVEPLLTVEKGMVGAVDVTVPVGPEGLVSLELTGGMGHVAVDVIGYSVGAAF